jgi:sec-independent protein translocase protein TatA
VLVTVIGAFLRLALVVQLRNVATIAKRASGGGCPGRRERDVTKREGADVLRNGLEPWHLLIVAIFFVLLFGSKKLPDTARALGRSMRILKSEAKAMKEEVSAEASPVDATAARTAEEQVRPTTGEPPTTVQ